MLDNFLGKYYLALSHIIYLFFLTLKYKRPDIFNGIFINGNVLGDTMFYGRGAGKLPTASAVVADVVDAARHLDTNIMTIWDSEKVTLGDMSTFECRYFVRTNSKEAEVEATFGNVEYVAVEGLNEVAFVTEKMAEGDFEAKAKALDVIYRLRTAL